MSNALSTVRDDSSGLVRWFVLRDELRERARKTAQHVNSKVEIALQQHVDPVQAPAPDAQRQQ